MTAARRTVLRRRMDSRRLRPGTWTPTRRPATAWRAMMRRARWMNPRRLRTRRSGSRRPMMRRTRPDHGRADDRRTHNRRTHMRWTHMRRTINRWPQMMMPPGYDDRHRQHDGRRARQPLQIIFRHPAGGAGVIDLAPALRATFDLDCRVARQCRDHRIIGARPFAQIDVGGGHRRRGVCSGGQHCREHRGSKTDGDNTLTHFHTTDLPAPTPVPRMTLHPAREEGTTPSLTCHCRA